MLNNLFRLFNYFFKEKQINKIENDCEPSEKSIQSVKSSYSEYTATNTNSNQPNVISFYYDNVYSKQLFEKNCDFFNEAKRLQLLKVETLLDECWKEDKELLMKIIFHIRDKTDGKGCRKCFMICYKWLIKTHYDVAVKNLKYIPEFGCFKDLIILMDTSLKDEILDFISVQIKDDLEKIKNNKRNISLVCKWIPSPKSKYDRQYNFCKEISQRLGYTDKNYEMFYRKNVLIPLRKKIYIFETHLSSKKWNSIRYSKLSDFNLSKYKHKFIQNDSERFKKWIILRNQPTHNKNLHISNFDDLKNKKYNHTFTN